MAGNFVRQAVGPAPLDPDRLLDFWRHPTDGLNLPEAFLDDRWQAATVCLVDMMKEVPRDASILELGCGAGRNLRAMRAAGFTNLAGIDISEEAVRMLGAITPDHAFALHEGDIHERLYHLPPVDAVVSVATMQHLDDKQFFLNFRRLPRTDLFLIEDETRLTRIDFPRSYRPIFERYGFNQVSERSGLELSLEGGVMARHFRRAA